MSIGLACFWLTAAKAVETGRAKSWHTPAPELRRQINQQITAELNRRLGLSLNDAFCGFKAYSRRGLQALPVTETGYAMPLEVWVLAVAAGLKITELPVPLVYLDASRSFGGALDDAATRLAHYREVLDHALRASGGGGTDGLEYGGGSVKTKADA